VTAKDESLDGGVGDESREFFRRAASAWEKDGGFGPGFDRLMTSPMEFSPSGVGDGPLKTSDLDLHLVTLLLRFGNASQERPAGLAENTLVIEGFDSAAAEKLMGHQNTN
jgi:hypothetical protein